MGTEIESAHLIAYGHTSRVVPRDGHGQSVLPGVIASTSDGYTGNQPECIDLGRRDDHEPVPVPDFVSCRWIRVDPVYVTGARHFPADQISSLPVGSPSLAHAASSARACMSCSVTPANNSPRL